MSAVASEPGRLVPDGLRLHGRFCQYYYWQCVDCKTKFPEMSFNGMHIPSCNGHAISKCPWCRSDSEPFKNGRGR